MKKRLELGAQQIQLMSAEVSRYLFSSPRFISAETVALYSPIKNETDTEEVYHFAIQSGKSVFYPRVNGDVLEFFLVRDLSELAPGRFGVLEPSPASAQIPPEELDLIILPGLAFDRKGSRLGYGMGYYDRTLNKTEALNRVGFCFSFQLRGDIPEGEHDQRVGHVVTEKGFVNCIGGS